LCMINGEIGPDCLTPNSATQILSLAYCNPLQPGV